MTVLLSAQALTVGELEQKVGQEVGVSSWQQIDQAMIDAFANVTNDHQFIHVDPERAEKTTFGGTIAHGFLTLSLLSAMAQEAQPTIIGSQIGINYGFDKVRFLTPVRCGDNVRGRFVLAGLTRPKMAEIDVVWDATVEIADARRPALVASWLNRFFLAKDAEDIEC
ncbi:MaoC family dehydratase [uncultured Roseibium sp.]|uniref:MaoC family dehydratase n=1 Tax=uncultured Roseibium sp. TaxID=1936171 RepID=UPI0026045C06|nr:MaoC family dehydratase [uncultured Roseibium sp.]